MLARELAPSSLADTSDPYSNAVLRPWILTFLSAAGSLLTCYCGLLTAAIVGWSLGNWNAHLQAVVMWFSVAALGSRAGWHYPPGVMAFSNDPVPCDEPVLDALRLALAIRGALDASLERLLRLGFPVGVGITAGYATFGMIGPVGGAGYTAIGNPVNLAARLCDQTSDGEILIDQRAYLDVENAVTVEPAGVR